mmetsp:Transcript_50422/g.141084  ORF Transcript_50422/g.141084 Transcript_50422/m.141084 type:complete len:179 (-) Transcript_50422:443-979(-)
MATSRGLLLASGSLAGRYVCGDTLTQHCIERREDHDLRRTFLFGSFGAVMGAPAYFFFSEFPQRVLAPRLASRWQLVMTMIAIDGSIFMPLVYLPTFYTFREAVYSKHTDVQSLVVGSCSYWRRHVSTDMTAASPLLVCSDVLMFTAIPAMWRVPFISGVGMLWVVYISLKRGSQDAV